MVRTIIWGLLLSVAFAAPAHAQGKKVVTINPDGSVTISNPQGGEAQTLPAPKSSLRRQPPFIDALPPEERTTIVPRQPAKAPVKPEKPKVEPPVEKQAPEMPQTGKPVTEKPQRKKIATPDTPVKEKTEKPVTPKPQKKSVPKLVPKKAGKDSGTEKEEPALREPAESDSMGRADPRVKASERRPGPVTPDEAKRIALDIGPPARAVDVYPADYNGRKVFQVVFHTEEGERYVLVDRKSGAIVND